MSELTQSEGFGGSDLNLNQDSVEQLADGQGSVEHLKAGDEAGARYSQNNFIEVKPLDATFKPEAE